MELPSGVAKADNPMVAEKGDLRLQNVKQSTTKKWDLSAQDDFPVLAWNAELGRCKRRPGRPNERRYQGAAGHSRVGASAVKRRSAR
eukprot:5962756-Prymnesium_polylepis.1